MHDLPFDRPGRFWRGNLHTHSNHSDGALDPRRISQLYAGAGYDFLAITDHFRAQYDFPLTDTRALRTPTFTTLLGAELHAPRTEFSSEWHIIAVGLPLDFAPTDPAESGPGLARRVRAAGAFIGMAHPAASLLILPDAQSLDAADDAHFQPQDPPGCQAWVQVRAESLEPGPDIQHIGVHDGKITIRCSPASRVLVTGCVPGKQVRAGDGLTECSLPLDMFHRSAYVRVTVVDAAGRRAWSNPIWSS